MRIQTALHRTLAGAIGLASLGYGLFHVWPFTIDDAGIVYAYAKHLSSGVGPRAVVGGPIVEGYSDFLWVFLLTGFARLGIDLPLAAKVLGALLLLITGYAAARIVRLGRPMHPAAHWVEAIPAVLIGLCPELVVWAPSGLENALFWALMLCLLWQDGEEADAPGRFPWSALLAVGLSLTRPEGIVYAGIVTLGKLLHAALCPSHRRQLVRYLSLLAGPLVLYHAIHYAIFRELVPNTYFAKAPGQGVMKKGFTYAHEGLKSNYFYAVVPLGFIGLFSGMRRSFPLFASAVAALAFAVYSRGDWMPHHRFVSLALPAMATLSAMGVLVLANAFGTLTRRTLIGGLVAIAFTFGLSYRWYDVQVPRFTNRALVWCHFCNRVVDAIEHAQFLGSVGLGAGTFLTNDFGGPSYLSSHSFYPIDLLGLCDPGFGQIEYGLRTGGGIPRYDLTRLQHAFSEQEEYPTLLFFGPNFWRTLSSTPEAFWGYFDVHLPRIGRQDYIPTHMHRGAFVDFFPPVHAFVFQPIDDRFVLAGSGAFVHDKPEGEIEVTLSLLQRAPHSERVALMLRAGGIQGTPLTLFGKHPELASVFRANDPLIVRLGVRPPFQSPPNEMIELGVRHGDLPWVFQPLLQQSAARPWRERPPLLPFPNAMPGTTDPELLELGHRLRRLISQRKERSDYALKDEDLGARFLGAGKTAEAKGERTNAYLAYVSAIQADRDLTRVLYRRIAALRPQERDATFTLELALLLQFYATGDPYWQLALIEHFARSQLWDKASYFANRLPSAPSGESPAWGRTASRLREVVLAKHGEALREATELTPVPLPGIESDFEAGTNGWTFDPTVFGRARADSGARPLIGGVGESVLTSEGPYNHRGVETGAAESAEFVVQGRAMSFLLAGGGRGHSVELVVDGEVGERATGPHSRYFFPVFWDLRRWRGHRARLRLVDGGKDADGYIALDSLRIWPDP